MANKNLLNAKAAKNDEFYTRLEDIEAELQHYTKYFAGKIIYCNCDDPEKSNFWRYFHENFERLHLKRLISTHYESAGQSYTMTYDGGNDKDISCGVKTPMYGDGDFRSAECLQILDEADIVVTNGPFSMFRALVKVLVEHKKKFILWGNNNCITYKEIFPLIKQNEIWLGYLANKTCIFRIPDSYTKWDKKNTKQINDGHKYCKVPSISVFTNLDIDKRHQPLILSKRYYPAEYPKYDNYDAINVDKVAHIPMDYCESWEVSKDESSLFPEDDWEVVRKGFRENIETVFIIPAKNTALRDELHEHSEGYREHIENEIFRILNKNIAYCNGIIGAPKTVIDKLNREQFEIIGEDESGGRGLSSCLFDESFDIKQPLLKKNENTQEYSSERYCNGIIGVPITVLDKYNPQQFRIIWQAAGNTRACCSSTLLRNILHYERHAEDRGGCGVFNDKRIYCRILIQKIV